MRCGILAFVVACGGVTAPTDGGNANDAGASDASTGVSAIATGNGYTCAIKSGSTWCWNVDTDGNSTPIPSMSTTIPTAKSLCSASLNLHACALTVTGDVFCWGEDMSGEEGVTPTDAFVKPTKVAGLPVMTAIACGDAHTCALAESGDVYCWGDDRLGELGDGAGDGGGPPQNDSSNAVHVSALHDVTAIAAGENFSCALSSGEVWCWGFLPPETNGPLFSIPTKVTALTNVTSIAAGEAMVCAIAQGNVFCWGSGTLGDGNPATQTSTPVMVSGITDATSVSISGAHGCVASASGALRCWGSDNSGQLGDGKIAIEVVTPIAVAIPPVSVVSAGGVATCAITDSGTLMCWGEIESADGGNVLTPTEVIFQ